MTECWQVGIVRHPIADALSPGGLSQKDVVWLPDPGSFRFIADPFGLMRDGRLTVFVEAYDYRTKLGEIHYYSYDDAWRRLDQGVALKTSYHLSYPFLIENGGEIYMLPEQHRSGALTLYRAVDFPSQWEPVSRLLDLPAVDASVIHHGDRWWMFYALAGLDRRAEKELHLAWADALTGPWHAHAGNPVRTGLDASRPGGSPFVSSGALYLPVQNCTGTYGGSVNLLRIDTLTPDAFSAIVVGRVLPGGWREGYDQGLHTLSAAGSVTLIDVNRSERKAGRHWIKLQYQLNRLLGRLGH